MDELNEVRREIVHFLRGQYCLNEVAGRRPGLPCLRFCKGKETLTTLQLYEDHFCFLVHLGQEEQERFEEGRDGFSAETQALFDAAKPGWKGRRLALPVQNLQEFAEVKKLLLMKMPPNRKPLPREGAVYSKCGHRCDYCVHYADMTKERRATIEPHLVRVYGGSWASRCPGCGVQEAGKPHPCMGDSWCRELTCAKERGLSACVDCGLYPCPKATAGYKGLEPRDISADDVTYAILPYVPFQYEEGL